MADGTSDDRAVLVAERDAIEAQLRGEQAAAAHPDPAWVEMRRKAISLSKRIYIFDQAVIANGEAP